jgi:hypothetical protein
MPVGASEEAAEKSEVASSLVPQFPPSRVLFMNVTLETFARAAEREVLPASEQAHKARSVLIDEDLAILADVLPTEEVQAMRGQAPDIAPLMARHRWIEVASFEPVISLGDVDARMRSARSDVRRAMVLLKPDTEPPPGDPSGPAD